MSRKVSSCCCGAVRGPIRIAADLIGMAWVSEVSMGKGCSLEGHGSVQGVAVAARRMVAPVVSCQPGTDWLTGAKR